MDVLYKCENCMFSSIKQSNYEKHLLTHKHITQQNKTTCKYKCNNCAKAYITRGGLWKHKRHCVIPINKNINDIDNSQLITHLLQENKDIKQMLFEQNKQILELSSKKSNVINNISNQKFNLNFFLNTTCKDAMNITEFIENISIDLEEIENVGKKGYVSGMTNIILSRIRDLDITKRPLHCTDIKREIMYIKDNDEWHKDTLDKKKMRNIIAILSKQNYNMIPKWRNIHPECTNMEHPSYDLCIDIMKNTIGGVGVQQFQMDSKIIKNVAKQIFINK